MSSAISFEQIGTNRYAPEGANAIVLFSFNGVDGLTLAQLVMAVCIRQACLVEDQSVLKMNQVNSSAAYLDVLAQVGSYVMAHSSLDATLDLTKTSYIPRHLDEIGMKPTYRDFIAVEVGIGYDALPENVRDINDKTLVFDFLESDMSKYSTDNEEQMIDLQSYLSRRDSTYNASSSIVKRLGQTMNGVANNF